MESRSKVQEIIKTLTVEEKARLLSGNGSWHTYDCNGKIPSIMMTDGPHGLRKQIVEDFADVNASEIATCFPTESAIASSWNTEVAATMAKTIAKEALKEKVSIVLGCGVNIKRSPLCGRNFEYFSEDPFLAGTMATAYIEAMQKEGVGTSLKHFAGNSQETQRQTTNSQIDERALREIYLSAFEKVVKVAKPTTVMASYNKINGEYSCASKWLLTDILRGEWGFDGCVISDWGAALDVVSCIKAGMDLEMPDSCGLHTPKILEALENGTLSKIDFDKAVENVLTLILERSEKLCDSSVDYQKHHEIARELACESAVLLKNDGILPVEKNAKLVVIGELAEKMRYQGGGSSHISTIATKNALESLAEKGADILYAKGYQNESDKCVKQLENQAIMLAKTGLPVLFFGGLTERFESEGYDRKTMSIPDCQLQLLDKIIAVNPNVVFVSFGGSPMEMPFADSVRAILHMYLGGQAVGDACADLLVGDVNPSGKLAETFPLSIEDVPCKDYFATGIEDIEYRESIFVGYRYYSTFNRPVRYEFGYGLSYTTFSYSDLVLDKKSTSDGNVTVTFTVTNTGERDGSEVAEVYVVNPDCDYLRSKKELKGFTKVALKKGESKKITVTLDSRSFSIYDVEEHGFCMPSGEYRIEVGASLSDIRLSDSIQVSGKEYIKEDRERLKEYFQIGDSGSVKISKEQYRILYGKELSDFANVKKGEFTKYHALGKIAQQSLIGKIVFFVVKRMLYSMNKGKSKDDPAVQMLIQGVTEGPIEALLCMSGGMFPVNVAEAAVIAANGDRRKALRRLRGK